MSDDSLDEVLDALMSMFEQYCYDERTTSDGRPMYNHACMSAGEEAADVLLKCGRIKPDQLVYP